MIKTSSETETKGACLKANSDIIKISMNFMSPCLTVSFRSNLNNSNAEILMKLRVAARNPTFTVVQNYVNSWNKISYQLMQQWLCLPQNFVSFIPKSAISIGDFLRSHWRSLNLIMPEMQGHFGWFPSGMTCFVDIRSKPTCHNSLGTHAVIVLLMFTLMMLIPIVDSI